MLEWFVAALLTPIALWVALPALVDLTALLLRHPGQGLPGKPRVTDEERLLFLIPAHDEGMLVVRCITSLLAIEYPASHRRVVVIADNCSDDTATQARRAGAEVLERHNADLRGKGHAIEWALSQLSGEAWDAVVIIDADTIVLPNYGRELSRWSPLRDRALQTYDTSSNEFATWLTRLAGLFARSRYEIALPIKEAAGLSVPLTGDGIVLGRDLLTRFPWRVRTITEGWEWYARLTLAGVRVGYANTPIVFAQETQSLGQSATQRSRWTSGRLEVFSLYRHQILAPGATALLQRLDLIAELTSLGPIVRGGIAIAGLAGALLLTGSPSIFLVLLFSLGIIQPAAYAVLVLRNHPEPWQTVRALCRLPAYAAWRLLLAVKTAAMSPRDKWIRTARSEE